MLTGCDGDGGTTSVEGEVLVSLEVTGLRPLPEGLNYQAWLVVGTEEEFWGSPLVLFDVDPDGLPVDPAADTLLSGPYFALVAIQEILGVAVSVEASDTLLAYSSYTFVLGGDLVQGTAQLTPAHWIALGQDPSAWEGGFVLATPTNEDPEDELAGIWFMDPGGGTFTAGLQLPEAPVGWNYEGWVHTGDQHLSMGKFVSPAQSDSSSTYSGTLAPPTFPGEDFLGNPPAGLTFPPDLAGAEVSVTLEPWAELDVARDEPFFLKLLGGTVPAEPSALVLYEMEPPETPLPSGTATVQSTGEPGT